jgi:perosamine synthetase
MKLSPQPRFLLYSSFRDYLRILYDITTTRIDKGEYCLQLEEWIKSTYNTHHALCMPQARVGIYLAIKSITQTKKNIILSPYTIIDVVNMVICAGATPIFCDIDEETCNINPHEAEKLIDSNTAAIMVTHLHGLVADILKFKTICQEHDILLIEDAAQAFGAKINDRHAGTIGDIGIFSFGRYKHVSSLFGGLLVTNQKSLHTKISNQYAKFTKSSKSKLIKRCLELLIKDLLTKTFLFQLVLFQLIRISEKYDIMFLKRIFSSENDLTIKEKIPSNYLELMSESQAKMVISQLAQVKANNFKRIENAQKYYQALKKNGILKLPPMRNDLSHIYTYYPVQVNDRECLIRTLILSKRDASIQHYKNCADLVIFEKYYRECPIARKISHSTILLPTYPRYRNTEIEKTCDEILKFVNE